MVTLKLKISKTIKNLYHHLNSKAITIYITIDWPL